jgi:hypothetical protein
MEGMIQKEKKEAEYKTTLIKEVKMLEQKNIEHQKEVAREIEQKIEHQKALHNKTLELAKWTKVNDPEEQKRLEEERRRLKLLEEKRLTRVEEENRMRLQHAYQLELKKVEMQNAERLLQEKIAADKALEQTRYEDERKLDIYGNHSHHHRHHHSSYNY